MSKKKSKKPINKNNYQQGFSKQFPRILQQKRKIFKAKKILAILKDYFKNMLSNKTCLDIGSSSGIITNYLGAYFKKTIGIDIDEHAIKKSKKLLPNVSLMVGDALNLSFQDNSIDVIICNHIYEHTPDANKLISEIYRVLKPKGVCFFGAGNKYWIIEGHYFLPFLSWLPKKLSHIYLKITKKGQFYYENLLSYFKLIKLCKNFTIIDYTYKVIKNPKKYHSSDMIKPDSIITHIPYFIYKILKPFLKSYLWILKKE
ncbi:MAG: class I SAM-dependent methyltransferase [Spirochaetes bacterium]|nr:class I SAM-dependent methyltransferase [Spirochaetota bacterium]